MNILGNVQYNVYLGKYLVRTRNGSKDMQSVERMGLGEGEEEAKKDYCEED